MGIYYYFSIYWEHFIEAYKPECYIQLIMKIKAWNRQRHGK